jgi:thiol-disulfide isomerase/thioredoxin
MKNYISILFVFLSFNYLLAQTPTLPVIEENGIKFEHNKSWQIILEKAKKENKYIFVDCYTTWCGPCKWMAKNIFTNDSVGLFYNINFINFKQDMEKGEGPALLKQWGIYAYPTFLFFDPNGNPVHRIMGGMAQDKFIQEGQTALGGSSNLDSLAKKYNNGNRDPIFLKKYATALLFNNKSYLKELEAYFKTQKDADLLSVDNFEVMKNLSTDIFSKEIQFLIKNLKAFRLAHGKAEVDSLLNKLVEKNKQIASFTSDKKRLNAAENLASLIKQD